MAIPKRTGAPEMVKVAKRLCDLINHFGPIIEQAFPTSPALSLALSSAYAACGALEKALKDEVIQPGV